MVMKENKVSYFEITVNLMRLEKNMLQSIYQLNVANKKEREMKSI